MVSTADRPVHPAPPATAAASWPVNLVTTLLGLWFTVGLFLDAWAHNNVPDLETFFTPWHAVFYSGFVATAAWIGWTVRGALRAGRPDFAAMPPGYAASTVAIAGFALFGVGDALWHTAFGIEQDIDILFSPTHVGLIATMLVIVTTPVRAMWADRGLPTAPTFRALLPALLSTALATTLVLLFLQYANAMVYTNHQIKAALAQDTELTARLVASVAVTTLVLLVPLLTLARRWVLPPGAATLVFAAVAGLSGAIRGFGNATTIGALLAGGVLADVLLWRSRPTADRPTRYRTFAGLAALVTWVLYLAVAGLTGGPVAVVVPDTVRTAHPEGTLELYTGIPLVQTGLAVLLAILFAPGVPVRDRLTEPA